MLILMSIRAGGSMSSAAKPRNYKKSLKVNISSQRRQKSSLRAASGTDRSGPQALTLTRFCRRCRVSVAGTGRRKRKLLSKRYEPSLKDISGYKRRPCLHRLSPPSEFLELVAEAGQFDGGAVLLMRGRINAEVLRDPLA